MNADKKTILAEVKHYIIVTKALWVLVNYCTLTIF